MGFCETLLIPLGQISLFLPAACLQRIGAIERWSADKDCEAFCQMRFTQHAVSSPQHSGHFSLSESIKQEKEKYSFFSESQMMMNGINNTLGREWAEITIFS
ncbi:hypothetical protein AMECASPLE_015458 [Ameca splendens]|uniref:Uncharacterized protein n=1 Tax=Ameca splendens TaxID=208324 RepID=A0ABV0ZMC1_9TELE